MARGESFWRHLGARGLVYGIQRFGASAPQSALAGRFGFTADALATRVLAHLNG